MVDPAGYQLDRGFGIGLVCWEIKAGGIRRMTRALCWADSIEATASNIKVIAEKRGTLFKDFRRVAITCYKPLATIDTCASEKSPN